METLSHEMFVGLSYGVTGVVFVGLVAWVLMTGRRRRAEIARLEAKGSRAL
ncbi:MAG: heme exporter protein CcmD [Pseudomonadota bacterium]